MSEYLCIFCGSDKKLSREHVWARWLRNYLKPPNPESSHYISGSHTEHKIIPGKLLRPGTLYSQRLRIVCKQCNETWMSRLQESAKPYIVNLINGWIKLGYEAQSALSAWSTMFTMVNEFSDPATATVPQGHRTYFMENLAPPPSWTIWIGRLDTRLPQTGGSNHHGAEFFAKVPEEISFTKYNFQSTSIALGELFFLTLMFEPAYPAIDEDIFLSIFDLRKIYPYNKSTKKYPAPSPMSAEMYYEISNFFAQDLGLPAFSFLTGPKDGG